MTEMIALKMEMPGKSVGYHSVYITKVKARAERYAERLNRAHPDMRYWVETVQPVATTADYKGKPMVKLPGSVGWIMVQET